MFDKAFAQWWLGRIQPFKDVPPEKLEADREAMRRQQESNQNYANFLNDAILPARGIRVTVPRSLGRCDRLEAATELKKRDGTLVPVDIAVVRSVASGKSCRMMLAAPAVPAGSSVPVVIRRNKKK